MAKLNEIKVGMKVKVYDAPDKPRDGEIIAIQDKATHPGKIVGVKFAAHHPKAHECDGLCEKGYGWWTKPENIAV